jgi:hypothetical protein
MLVPVQSPHLSKCQQSHYLNVWHDLRSTVLSWRSGDFDLLHQIRSLKNGKVQPTRNMPCNMTACQPVSQQTESHPTWQHMGDSPMQRPSPRIIRPNLQHNMLTTGQQLDVSSLRICWIRYSTIPSSGSLMQDEEIVAMHVHRMRREASRIVDHKCDWAVRAVVVYVPVCRVGEIALVGKKENWCVIIAAESIRPLARWV